MPENNRSVNAFSTIFSHKKPPMIKYLLSDKFPQTDSGNNTNKNLRKYAICQSHISAKRENRKSLIFYMVQRKIIRADFLRNHHFPCAGRFLQDLIMQRPPGFIILDIFNHKLFQHGVVFIAQAGGVWGDHCLRQVP